MICGSAGPAKGEDGGVQALAREREPNNETSVFHGYQIHDLPPSFRGGSPVPREDIEALRDELANADLRLPPEFLGGRTNRTLVIVDGNGEPCRTPDGEPVTAAMVVLDPDVLQLVDTESSGDGLGLAATIRRRVAQRSPVE